DYYCQVWHYTSDHPLF
nr:immunoglobulin light chain junction region [Macaca mulatta]MOW00662.1 immunoglobulin light chain junction region [Macaca mulatta]MOW01546.1 immunoglobulin light chain junction region [Macaca mulatta]